MLCNAPCVVPCDFCFALMEFVAPCVSDPGDLMGKAIFATGTESGHLHHSCDSNVRADV